MFFAFSLSILGFSFAFRTFTHFIARDLVDRTLMTKIGTAYFASTLALIFFVPTSRFSLWFALFFPLAIAAFSLSAHVSRRSRIFQSDALSVLSILILKMKSGRSFRSSLIEATSECDQRLRVKLSEIANVVAFSQQEKSTTKDQNDPFMRELIEEFRLIDQQPHSSLRRLSVLREKIRVEDDFRRRSGQVLARLRAQSFVMCVLYACVFAFMCWHFGFKANARALCVSAMCFLCGTAWMWIGGRRLKWKV
jgi:Flp pilus assembly protein TadB